MRVIDLGQIGEPFTNNGIQWNVLGISPKWLSVIEAIAPASQPHDIQIKVLRDCRLLESRRNLIISGPTNSGKSLLGYLGILSGITDGRRALLIEPFRALAREKYDELTVLLSKIYSGADRKIGVEITTGDYRLNGETLMAAPPQNGEIVIATPERIDAIMRNPEFDQWISSFSTVCIDEAHLISNTRRGPSLENVVTRFLCEKAPPRVILLSATLGNCDAAKQWLQPCDIAESIVRRPELSLKLIMLDENEKADDVVLSIVEQELLVQDSSALIFVYRTDDATRLAKFLTDKLKQESGIFSASAYHSKMPAGEKALIKCAFEEGQIKCLVSTTALGAGINMPVTHVIIRDLTFGIEGPLPIEEILQMMGRAGRRNKPGWSAVIRKQKDHWEESAIIDQLKNPSLPVLQSAVVSSADAKNGKHANPGATILQASKLLLGQLVRRDQQARGDLFNFFDKSLGGTKIRANIETAIGWLCDGQRVLAWEDEKGIGATALGKSVSLAGIPVEVGAAIGALIRDILSLDTSPGLLGKWTPIDSLILLELLEPRERGIRRFSIDLAERIDAWMEKEQIKPVLYTEWIRGATGSSRADEVLGSLGIQINSKQNFQEMARKYAYMATLRAILVYQLSKGMRTVDVSRRWGITGLDGVEERWRDHLLWLLAGIAEILDVRCFYYFLCTECTADNDRIENVKKDLAQIRQGIFQLLGMLRFCSPLGPLFRDLEASKAGVGIRTKEKLEAAGIMTFAQINKCSIDELHGLGIRSDIANKLKNYIKVRAL